MTCCASAFAAPCNIRHGGFGKAHAPGVITWVVLAVLLLIGATLRVLRLRKQQR